ncbi:MAG: DUF1223 domain-containing protein [Deltaproteobacteria bacterium]|nr:DUF1223 domain-containing protein [Deltaproteobacteria bacterium]
MRTAAVAFAVLYPLTLGAACEHEPRASRDPSPQTADSQTAPVLLELFTSQGCSSCPPADELVRRAVHDADAPNVIALVYHVDYWNSLGWPDPFSNPRWTQRQRDYADAIGSNRLYTPQVLLDGQDRGVGTSGHRMATAVADAGHQANAMTLTLHTELDDDRVRVEVEPQWANTQTADRAVVMVAVTDSGHRTRVPRGENAGRVLSGEFVVRDLARACAVPASGTTRCRASLSVQDIDDRSTMQVVAFAQDPQSWQVLGVAASSPSSP